MPYRRRTWFYEAGIADLVVFGFAGTAGGVAGVLCRHDLLVLGGGGFAAAQCAAVLFASGAEADLCPRDGAAVRLNGAGGGQPGRVLSDPSGEAHCRGGDRGRYVSWSLFRLYGGGAVRLFV